MKVEALDDRWPTPWRFVRIELALVEAWRLKDILQERDGVETEGDEALRELYNRLKEVV